MNRNSAARALLAVGGGLLLTVGFPGVGIAGAAWIGPGVLLGAGWGCRGKRAFWTGYLGGLAHYLTTLSWLVSIPYTIHGVPIGPIFGWLALSAYCAIYPGLWVWMCWAIWPEPAEEGAGPIGRQLDRLFAGSAIGRGRWALCAAVLWVALEMARGWMLTGFPWNFLGASQYQMLPMIQIAAFTGVYGVSFLMVWTSVCLVMALVKLTRQPGRGVWNEAGLPLLTAAAVAIYGASKVASLPVAETELKVALVQPNLPPSWRNEDEDAGFDKLMGLSEEALAGKPDLLIWPEGGVGGLTPERLRRAADLAASNRVWLVACAATAEEQPQGQPEDFNSGLLVSPAGKLEAIYHKRQLVIFGEYVPVWLGFLRWVTPITGGFTPGQEPVQFQLRKPDAQISTLICFEDVFPAEARQHVTAQTDFLVNLTDDGWFGDGAELQQHAANAVFRAVENGVPLVRCTDTGLTCWIDAQGRIRKVFGAARPGFMAAGIPLRATGDESRTFYNRNGDWFGAVCCVTAVWLLGRRLLGRKSSL